MPLYCIFIRAAPIHFRRLFRVSGRWPQALCIARFPALLQTKRCRRHATGYTDKIDLHSIGIEDVKAFPESSQFLDFLSQFQKHPVKPEQHQGVSVEKNGTYASRRRAYSSRHHGWRAPPEAKIFRARSLATIDTLPNWPKTRGLELAQNRPFTGGHFILFYFIYYGQK